MLYVHVPERSLDESSAGEAVSEMPIVGNGAAGTHHSHLGALGL